VATKLENRSLDRALTILEVLARDAHCSLHQLHERTRLPKSTIRRLLGTLRKHHFVRQGTTDALYRANVVLPWADDREYTAMVARLVEVALPHMIQLTSSVGWPSNLLAFRSGRMRVIDSTLSLSPFEVDNSRAVDWEVSIYGSATGLAYLAALDDAQVLQVVREHRGDPRWGIARFGLSEKALLRDLRDIRKMGYATRRTGYGSRRGSSRTNAIAIAIRDADRPVGAINLRWRRNYLPPDRFAAKYLGEFRATADAISADLTKRP
jgi:IclR family mhp operon transcriptional activator